VIFLKFETVASAKNKTVKIKTHHDFGFSDDDFIAIVEIFEELLRLDRKYDGRDLKRLELVRVLIAIKNQKSKAKIASLQQEITRLEQI
jgi:hypothetical protein